MELTEEEITLIDKAINYLEENEGYSCIALYTVGNYKLVQKYREFYNKPYYGIWPGLKKTDGNKQERKQLRLLLLEQFKYLKGSL